MDEIGPKWSGRLSAAPHAKAKTLCQRRGGEVLLFRRTTPLTRSTEEARACRGLKTPSSRARPQTPTPRASRAVSRAVVSDATLPHTHDPATPSRADAC